MVELFGYVVGMLIAGVIIAAIIRRRQRNRPVIRTGRVLDKFESEHADR